MCSTPELSGRNRGRSRTARQACCDQRSRPASPVAAARHGRTGQPVSPLPGAAVRCAPTDVRRHFAAVSIYQAQYPLVAGFAVRLAQDRAEQEFTDGLRELLDWLAATQAFQSGSAERRQGSWLNQLVRWMLRTPVAPRCKHYVSN